MRNFVFFPFAALNLPLIRSHSKNYTPSFVSAFALHKEKILVSVRGFIFPFAALNLPLIRSHSKNYAPSFVPIFALHKEKILASIKMRGLVL